MMDEDQLMDVLENRISVLESRVIGNTETAENINPACETLLHTNTIMSSVLSGREKINAVTRRLSELEKYLDPEFEEFSTADVALKTELILSMAPVLEESMKMLEQMSDLTPVLDSKEIKTVPDLSSRLEQLSLFHLEKKKSVDEISENIVYLLRQYNTVIENLTKAFVQWDNIVTQLEDSRKPKTLD